MVFDPEAGLYVFEVVLRFRMNREIQYSPPFVIQADDAEEAEEKVIDYLADLDLGYSFRIEELSEPYDLETYRQQVEDRERQTFPVLDELSEDELKEITEL